MTDIHLSNNTLKQIRQVLDKMRLSTRADEDSETGGSPENDHRSSTEWANAMLPVCFGAAMAIAMVSIQARSEIPASVHVVSLGVVLAIASFFVAKSIVDKFPIAGHVLERVGVFFMVTAFFVAMSIPLPLSLKVVTWIVYFVSSFSIFVCTAYL